MLLAAFATRGLCADLFAHVIADPDDEWVVAEALAGEAEVLVTGDAALRKLGTRAPLPIVSPRELWERLRRRER